MSAQEKQRVRFNSCRAGSIGPPQEVQELGFVSVEFDGFIDSEEFLVDGDEECEMCEGETDAETESDLMGFPTGLDDVGELGRIPNITVVVALTEFRLRVEPEGDADVVVEDFDGGHSGIALRIDSGLQSIRSTT